MGLREFFATDASAIIESVTTRYRRRWYWAKGEGINWRVEALYSQERGELGVRFRAAGNTASSLGRPGQTVTMELTVNGTTLRETATIERSVDFIVYYTISVVFNVSGVGQIRDISDVSLRLS